MYQYLLSSFSILLYYDSFFNNYFNLKHLFFSIQTLWDKKEPMIASDFVQLDPSLNLNSVQSALRSLLKKNYIEVSDIVYSGKVLTRRYIPVVSSEDYASENINGVLEDLLSSNILLQYVESENDIKVIERLQEKLEERKKILERKS